MGQQLHAVFLFLQIARQNTTTQTRGWKGPCGWAPGECTLHETITATIIAPRGRRPRSRLLHTLPPHLANRKSEAMKPHMNEFSFGTGHKCIFVDHYSPPRRARAGKTYGMQECRALPFEGVRFHRAAGLTRWQKMHKCVCGAGGELSNSEPKPELLQGKPSRSRSRSPSAVTGLDRTAACSRAFP
jgi:hypothetical protein